MTGAIRSTTIKVYAQGVTLAERFDTARISGDRSARETVSAAGFLQVRSLAPDSKKGWPGNIPASQVYSTQLQVVSPRLAVDKRLHIEGDDRVLSDDIVDTEIDLGECRRVKDRVVVLTELRC